MRKNVLIVASLLSSVTLFAQGEMDVLKLSSTEIKGTARYMGMAGAFGALGGDVTAITQNPGGIGVFRRSDVSLTVGFDNTSTTMNGLDKNISNKLNFDNINFVTTFDNGNYRFNFGFGYNSIRNFNRTYRGGYAGFDGSMTDLVAKYATQNQVPENVLTEKDPYAFYNWFGVLGYAAGIVRPTTDAEGALRYESMLIGKPDISTEMKESGYTDEYNITFGGNVNEIFSYGVSVGITEMRYRLSSSYDENFEGNKGYTLYNDLQTRASGVNLKAGFILSPIPELRISFAAHTPTWYSATDHYSASMETNTGIHYAPLKENSPAWGDYKFHTPYKLQMGVAGVLGKGLLSFEYELMDYKSSKLLDAAGYADSYASTNTYISEDFKAMHTFKIGAEYKLTNQLFVRAGYAFQTTSVNEAVSNGNIEMEVIGTQPHYYYDKSSQYITAGLGYRMNNFYVDLAYINKKNIQDYWGYTNTFYEGEVDIRGAVWDLKTVKNSAVLTVGMKF